MSQNAKLTNSLLSVASFIIIIAGLRASQSIVVPFLLSIFVAVISAPFMFFLVKKKVPTWLSLTIIISLILIMLALMGVLLGTSVNDFSKSLPAYQNKLTLLVKENFKFLASKGINLPNQEKLFENFDPGAVLEVAANMLKELSSVLGNAFLILLTVIFMLLEASGLPAKLTKAFGEKSAASSSLEQFAKGIKSYMLIKTNMSFLTGLCVYFSLLIFKVDYALLWGVLAFFLNYVPNIGSIIAAVPAVLLATVQHGFTSAIMVVFSYVVINLLIGNFVEPKFLGKELGLSTLVVFLSLVFWGWILGPVGMVLSVPLTMAVKIALEGSQDTRWLAIILGND